MGPRKFPPGHVGSQGSKGHFHQKCYQLLYDYVALTRKTYTYGISFETLLQMLLGIKINPGSFGVTGVNGHFH